LRRGGVEELSALKFGTLNSSTPPLLLSSTPPLLSSTPPLLNSTNTF
jgi:hypothetical protein